MLPGVHSHHHHSHPLPSIRTLQPCKPRQAGRKAERLSCFFPAIKHSHQSRAPGRARCPLAPPFRWTAGAGACIGGRSRQSTAGVKRGALQGYMVGVRLPGDVRTSRPVQTGGPVAVFCRPPPARLSPPPPSLTSPETLLNLFPAPCSPLSARAQVRLLAVLAKVPAWRAQRAQRALRLVAGSVLHPYRHRLHRPHRL